MCHRGVDVKPEGINIAPWLSDDERNSLGHQVGNESDVRDKRSGLATMMGALALRAAWSAALSSGRVLARLHLSDGLGDLEAFQLGKAHDRGCCASRPKPDLPCRSVDTRT